MIDTENVSVFLGLDVGKGEHHAWALDRSGRRLHDKPLTQDEQSWPSCSPGSVPTGRC